LLYCSHIHIIWLSDISVLNVTWWRLFQILVVCTKFDIYVCITFLAVQSLYILRNNISPKNEANLVVSYYSPVFCNMFVSQASFSYMPQRYSSRIKIVYLMAKEMDWKLVQQGLKYSWRYKLWKFSLTIAGNMLNGQHKIA
jgi:hypothetical protein